jgi:adenylyltransferase/sulfurtransferase
MDGIGHPKVENAAKAVAALNEDVTFTALQTRLTEDNVDELLAPWDVIADGSDNFATRFLLNDACRRLGKTLVSAAILRFDGQLSTFKQGGPCYRCIYPAPPPEGQIPSCSQAGILGAVAGMLGTMQANEVLKEILEIGDSMAGKLLIVDALSMTFRSVKVRKDPKCPVCSHEHP